MFQTAAFASLFQVLWRDYVGNLAGGLVWTLAYALASFIGATALGLVLALMRLNHLRIVRAPAGLYTEIFKNAPLLAIIFLTYFGLPSVGVKLNVFVAGALSLILFYAAYLSEIFRARRSRASIPARTKRPTRSASPAARPSAMSCCRRR